MFDRFFFAIPLSASLWVIVISFAVTFQERGIWFINKKGEDIISLTWFCLVSLVALHYLSMAVVSIIISSLDYGRNHDGR